MSSNDEYYEEEATIAEEIYEETDLISGSEWELWLGRLMGLLNKYGKCIDVIDFLGQIKMKVEDCSRAYTGMWTLDMLHQFAESPQVKQAGDVVFKQDVAQLQKEWSVIMDRIRPARKELIGKKCLEYFYENYAGATKVYTKDEAEKLASNDGDRWYLVCKKANDMGLNDNKEYKEFLAKIMVAMVKY